MQVILSTEPPDVPEHKCLALGIFSDEKPPRGICGFLDWRLNGFISREIKQGRISGAFREKVLIPFPGRINTEILFLFGLGPLADCNYDRIYTSAYSVIEAVDGMQLTGFAFDLPGENRNALTTAGIVETMITGFFDYLSKDVEKLTNMTSCIVTSADNAKNITVGIQNFKSHVQDMGSIDAGALEDSFAGN
ncbi:MAG: M17 family peptidase N-terminal domain-containing protein [Smithella sp.]